MTGGAKRLVDRYVLIPFLSVCRNWWIYLLLDRSYEDGTVRTDQPALQSVGSKWPSKQNSRGEKRRTLLSWYVCFTVSPSSPHSDSIYRLPQIATTPCLLPQPSANSCAKIHGQKSRIWPRGEWPHNLRIKYCVHPQSQSLYTVWYGVRGFLSCSCMSFLTVFPPFWVSNSLYRLSTILVHHPSTFTPSANLRTRNRHQNPGILALRRAASQFWDKLPCSSTTSEPVHSLVWSKRARSALVV